MPTNRTAMTILDHDFLEIRHRMLDIAAALDRIGSAPQSADALADPRMKRIHAAVQILSQPEAGRADRVQMTFSRPYDPNWQK